MPLDQNSNPEPGSDFDFHRKYWCFISYRHADNKEPGRQWATWLHQKIETYEVPTELVGTKNQRGEYIPERIFPVFRDEEELPADADLARPIEAALENSQFLVVLCSPQAANSAYVAQEIHEFKKLGRSQRILAALLEGEPNASRDSSKQGLECFPRPLMHPIGADGELLTGELAEPIASDFRLPNGAKGWTSPEAYRQALQTGGSMKRKAIESRVSTYAQSCNLAFLKIVAGILGVPLGVLTKRDQAYQLKKARRRQRILAGIATIVSLLAVLALVAGFVALGEKEKAESSLREIREGRSRYLADLSRERVDAFKYANAVALASRAIRLDVEDWPILRTAETALNYAYHSYRSAIIRPEFRLQGHEGTIEGGFFYDQDQRYLSWSYDGTVRIWDTASGTCQFVLRHSAAVAQVIHLRDQDRLLSYTFDGEFKIWDASAGRLDLSFKIDDRILGASLSSDQSKLLVSGAFGTVQIWSTTTGERLGDFPHSDESGTSFVEEAQWLDGATRILTRSFDGRMEIWDVKANERVAIMAHESRVLGMMVLSETTQFLSWSQDQSVRLWDLADGNELHRWEFAGPVRSVKQSKFDNSCYAWGGPELKHINLETYEEVQNYRHDGAVLGVLERAEAGKFLTRDTAGSVYLWTADGEIEDRVDTNSLLLGVSRVPESQDMVVFHNDGRVSLWQYNDGTKKRTIRTWRPHEGRITSGFVARSGNFVWTWAEDGALHISQLNNQKTIATVIHNGAVNGISHSDSGKLFATYSADGTIRLSSLVAEKNYQTLSHQAELITAQFAGDQLITVDTEGTVYLRSIESPDDVTEFSLEQTVSQVEIAASGDWMVAWNKDGDLSVHDLRRDKRLFQISNPADIVKIECAPDSSAFFILFEDGSVDIFREHSGEFERVKTEGPFERVLWDERAQSTAYALATDAILPLTPPDRQRNANASYEIQEPLWAGFQRSSERLLGISESGLMRAWSVRDGSIRYEVQTPPSKLFKLSPDAEWLLAASSNTRPTLVDTSTGSIIQRIDHFGVVAAHFLEAPKRLITVSGSQVIKVWGWDESKKLFTVDVQFAANSQLFRGSGAQFAGNYIFVADRVFDVRTGEPMAQLDRLARYKFSSDMSWAAKQTGSEVHLEPLIWELETLYAKAIEVLEKGFQLNAFEEVEAYENRESRATFRSITQENYAISKNLDQGGKSDTERMVVNPSTLGARVEMMITDTGELIVISDRNITHDLKYFEVDPQTKIMRFILTSGTLDLETAIADRLWRYFSVNTGSVLFVHMPDIDSDPEFERYFPIILGD